MVSTPSLWASIIAAGCRSEIFPPTSGNFNYNNDTISQNSGGCPNAAGDAAPATPWPTSCSVTTTMPTFQPGPFSPAGVAGNLNQYHFQYFAPYIQDDWKVTSRLTLNLGLRWDYRTVPFEARQQDVLV